MCESNTYKIVLIGGGASGLMLAAQLDLNGARGVILEGTSRLGSKLLMSGGGHCNITHGGSIKDFLNAYGDAGPSLRRCLYKHSNLELAQWLTSHGMSLCDEQGRIVEFGRNKRRQLESFQRVGAGTVSFDQAGRIFPASMKARDILDLLLKEARANGWEIRTDSKVKTLEFLRTVRTDRRLANENGKHLEKERQSAQAGEGGGVAVREHQDALAEADCLSVWKIGLRNGDVLCARKVVAASGGITYPETGSDGSVFGMLDGLGIGITEPRAALAPVFVENYPYSGLSGISVPDVSVTTFGSDAACTCKGSSARMSGDLLFTHDGFSGPAILNASRYAEPGQIIRIKYNKKMQELPKRLQRALEDRARGKSGDIKTTVLASLLDRDDFIVKGISERGMVTAGGVALEDVDLSTMQIKALPGLHVIGEALDADGITGGYNLQLCWSSAATAAAFLHSEML